MAYTDSILTPARDARNFILDNLEWASTFGNQFNQNFLTQQQIPEALSRTRLNDANNRFDLQDRMATWGTDLEANRLESELGVRTNRYALDDFDSAREAERRQREIQLQKDELELEFFDENRANKRLELENQRLQLEGDIEKRTFDRQYDELIGAIPGYSMLPPLERYTRLTDLANLQKVHPNVKARINQDFLESNARDFQMFNVYVSLARQVEQLRNSGVPENDVRLQTLRKRANDLRTLGINDEVIAAAAKNGLISMESAGYLLESPESTSPAQQAVDAPIPGGTGNTVPQENMDTGEFVDTYQSPTEVAAPPAPEPQAQVVSYTQPMLTSPLAYQSIVAAETNPSFPPEFRGMMFDRDYTQENINQKIDSLMAYAQLITAFTTDPDALEQVWNKIESVENFRQQNGW